MDINILIILIDISSNIYTNRLLGLYLLVISLLVYQTEKMERQKIAAEWFK